MTRVQRMRSLGAGIEIAAAGVERVASCDFAATGARPFTTRRRVAREPDVIARSVRTASLGRRAALFARVAGRGLGAGFALPAWRARVLFLDAAIDLFPMDLDLGGRLDAELHLTRAHLEHGDLHRITDPDVLA